MLARPGPRHEHDVPILPLEEADAETLEALHWSGSRPPRRSPLLSRPGESPLVRPPTFAGRLQFPAGRAVGRRKCLSSPTRLGRRPRRPRVLRSLGCHRSTPARATLTAPAPRRPSPLRWSRSARRAAGEYGRELATPADLATASARRPARIFAELRTELGVRFVKVVSTTCGRTAEDRRQVVSTTCGRTAEDRRQAASHRVLADSRTLSRCGEREVAPGSDDRSAGRAGDSRAGRPVEGDGVKR